MNLDDASSVTSLNSGLTLSRNVLVSDFFEMDQSWQAEAGYVLLLINLSYCLGFLAKLDCRVDFTEDLPSGKDVTHHIADMRNAACHLTSGERVIEKVGKNTAHFNVMIGRGASIHVNGVTVRSPCADDVCFCTGSKTLLLNRHLIRAYNEAVEKGARLADRAGLSNLFDARNMHYRTI